MRGGGFVGRRCCGDRQALSWLGRGLRAIDETISPSPDRVVRRRQIGHDESAAVVGHDRLDVSNGEVACFCDHPHAGLRTFRAVDDTPDVVVIDGDVVGRLLRLG